MDMVMVLSVLIALISAFAVVVGLMVLTLRRVVPPNWVHVVQTRGKTISYGKGKEGGNVYYEWPSWVPVLGLTKVALRVSNFDLKLDNYEAYDSGRLPFILDIRAYFRVEDSNMASQRVASEAELKDQLISVVQGAARKILSSSNIEEIMQGRSQFGEDFTKEVSPQLSSWGVVAIKNIELMDIRDARDSNVIRNIMEKKKSEIEKESRMEVARNTREASIAEIQAKRDVDLQQQEARQKVGLQTTETEKEIAIAKERAIQDVRQQEKVSKDREMDVVKVAEVRKAEIQKDVQVVAAQQEKETTVIQAEGQLEAKRKEAEGIQAEGQARAEAEKAMQLAPVQAQITLAKEIGQNESYQKYLVTVRQIEAAQTVGAEQARALKEADIKVISTSGSPSSGLTDVMDLFSAKGGTQVGAMLEGLAQTDTGKALLEKTGLSSKHKKESLNGHARQ